MMSVMAVMDSWNTKTPRCLQGIVIGLVVIGLGLGFGRMTGVMINPVRDITPRLAALTLGWKSDDAVKGLNGTQWWSVGFFAPFIGAILGSLFYIFVIGAQLRHKEIDIPRPDVNENTQKPENQKDWRSTAFVPKVNAQYAQAQNRVRFENYNQPS